MVFSLPQQKALAITPKITGLLSMTGSGVVAYDVLHNPRKMQHTYSRIMLAMSCFDFVSSFMQALSTWPIPAGSGPIYASGTRGSCTFQGFFIQLSLAGPMYNLFLSTHYLLVIRYGWCDTKLAKLERFIHPIIASITFGIAIAGLPLKIYNGANIWCWIAPNPSDPDRGVNADIYRWVFYYAELWSIVVIVTVEMALVVSSVVKTERSSSEYSAHSLSKSVKRQAFYYVSAFYITWTFLTVLRILQTIGVQVPYVIYLFSVMFSPLQGFFNCVVYFRPRYLRYRKSKNAGMHQTHNQMLNNGDRAAGPARKLAHVSDGANNGNEGFIERSSHIVVESKDDDDDDDGDSDMEVLLAKANRKISNATQFENEIIEAVKECN